MKRKPGLLFLFLLLPTVGVGLVVLLLMNWRVPTRIQFHVATRRLMFQVAGEESVDVLRSLNFRSITIQEFDSFKVNPDFAAIAKTSEFAARKDVPDTVWKRLALRGPVLITGQVPALLPSIAIEPTRQDADNVGTLDRVWVRQGTLVIVERVNSEVRSIAVKLDGPLPHLVLSFPSLFNLFGDHVSIHGISNPLIGQEPVALRLHLPSSGSGAEVTGEAQRLAFSLTLSTEKRQKVFPRSGIPVTSIDFTQQGPQGDVESAIVGTGEISYLDYPKIGKNEIGDHQFVVVEKLNSFRIEQIELNPDTKRIELTSSGTAGVIRTGVAGFAKDRRLTYFDMLWQNPQLIVLFSIVAWMLPTTLAGFRLYEELVK